MQHLNTVPVDSFSSGSVTLAFFRDNKGKIAEFKLSGGRVKDIVFDRR